MQQPSNGDGFSALQRPETNTSDFNAQSFLIWSILNTVHTCTLVKVISVTNNGGVTPVGFVDLQPLVNQVDGAGVAEPQAPVFDCPYFRLQGGANAVIIDPQVGDIGISVFADRDISSATANKGNANPGSRRKFSMADGLYLGGVLNGAPTQYVQFSSAGLTLTSPTAVTVNAPIVTVNASTSATVNTATASIVASALAAITAPVINLSAAGQTLKALVTDVFVSLFNSHTHQDPVSGTTSAPNQTMNGTHTSSTVKGA